MWMSLYFEINNKTHFLYISGHFFSRIRKKLKFKQFALFSVYYDKQYVVDKQYIVDGFLMMGVPLMDLKYTSGHDKTL